MQISLLYDEGPGRGLGHRRRMEALANALRSLGVESDLLSVEDSVPSSDVLVVDSYIYRADDTTRFRAQTIVAVDDLGRNLAVSVVIDPAPDASEHGHPAAARALAGARYALVDPTLVNHPRAPVAREVTSVLVSTGGTDARGYGSAIAHELTNLLPDATLSLVVGPWSSGQIPDRAIPIRTTGGLAEELATADVVVTAGGVTLLESLVLGRPTVAVITAENQRRYVEGAATANAVAAASVEDAAAVAAALAGDVDRRLALSYNATKLIDGRGASRVAQVLT